MRRCVPLFLGLSTLVAATAAQAQNNRPSLFTTKPTEQTTREKEVLNIKPPSTAKARTTTVERSSGQRLMIRTDETGTKVTEQGSGRAIWSSNRDAHDLKVGEYTAGGMGTVVGQGQKKLPE